MKKSRLFVISIKEIIYTLVFLVLGILLIILLFYMFLPKEDSTEQTSTTASYIPGIYTSCLSLAEDALTLELTVDANSINSINIIDSSEAVAAVYPLIPACLESIESELISGKSIDELTVNEDSKYTHIMLTDAISDLLNKASS